MRISETSKDKACSLQPKTDPKPGQAQNVFDRFCIVQKNYSPFSYLCKLHRHNFQGFKSLYHNLSAYEMNFPLF